MPPRSAQGRDVGAGRRPWVLAAVAAVATVLVIQSLFSDWMGLRLRVEPGAEEEAHHGIGFFGAAGSGYGVGLLVLAGLVGTALWWPRWRARLALAGLALAGLLLVDLALLLPRLAAAESAAAARVAWLRAAAEGRTAVAEFQVTSRGLFLGLVALVLFALVASQLARPGREVWAQAAVGAVLASVAVALPWVRLWIIDDSRPEVPFQVRTAWLWSSGVPGVLLACGLLALLVVVVRCLRVPGYARARWSLAAVLVAVPLFLGGQLTELELAADAFELRWAVSELMSLDATGAGAMFSSGAALLAIAALRSWWRGREEPSPQPAGTWLPDGLA